MQSFFFPLFSPGTGFSAPCPIRFPRADDQKEHRRHSNDLHRRRENRRIGAFPPYHYESANQNHKEKDDNKRVALPCRRYRAVSSQFWPEPKLVHCYPTLPSKLIEISFCASTANSIGSCCSTSLTKPLTTSPTASSCDSPRCTQ